MMNKIFKKETQFEQVASISSEMSVCTDFSHPAQVHPRLADTLLYMEFNLAASQSFRIGSPGEIRNC